MRLWRTPKHPIDRAVADLDREIARLQRQIRNLSQPPASHPQPADASRAPVSPAESMTAFVKSMLVPPKKTIPTTYRSRADLFEVTDEPLKELETEPLAFGQKPGPDLFSRAGGVMASGLQAAGASLPARPDADSRLAQYLSAGSIKTYRPLKYVRRRERNRFFMWLGLAIATLWLIYVVIR